MKKLALTLLPILFGLTIANPSFDMVEVKATEPGISQNYYDGSFILEEKPSGTYKIVGLDETNKYDYRVYSNRKDGKIVDEIASNAFDLASNVTEIMISKDILSIGDNSYLFDKVEYIHFTGSLTEWESYQIDTDAVIFDYACDEGFINYWNTFIRPVKDTSICDIGETLYQELLSKYNALTTYDYEIVNAYEDIAGETIEESMDYLDEFYNPKEKPKSEELPKDLTLILIICISVFGMSMIAIFYLLKKKDIIH